jgi:hypothetical protein
MKVQRKTPKLGYDAMPPGHVNEPEGRTASAQPLEIPSYGTLAARQPLDRMVGAAMKQATAAPAQDDEAEGAIEACLTAVRVALEKALGRTQAADNPPPSPGTPRPPTPAMDARLGAGFAKRFSDAVGARVLHGWGASS